MDFPKAALQEIAFTVEGCEVNRIKIQLWSFIIKSRFEIVSLNPDLK